MRMIFVNLPVTDLDRAVAFYTALGFTPDPRYADEAGAAVVIEENILVMLLTREKFAGFVAGQVGDPAQATSVINAVSAADRAECDDLLARALAAGGKPSMPAQDHGFMYGTSFTDPDGNVWEVAWMDPAALEG
ncbi:VOC family protein [Modestobacter marinus]|uniref:Glyoxalase n=2 Tax=Modestobacter marinus TaxID=477641 RepID=A0A846LUK3_9ACTN|nr:hypothetical protein [Modestobacter marinus]GGL52175.1 glyoxalase [Modestobacter marinus]